MSVDRRLSNTKTSGDSRPLDTLQPEDTQLRLVHLIKTKTPAFPCRHVHHLTIRYTQQRIAMTSLGSAATDQVFPPQLAPDLSTHCHGQGRFEFIATLVTIPIPADLKGIAPLGRPHAVYRPWRAIIAVLVKNFWRRKHKRRITSFFQTFLSL